MNSRSAWLALLAMTAALFVVGIAPSLSEPRVSREARAVPASPRVPPRTPVSLVPPSAAPAPTIAPGAPVPEDPRPAATTADTGAPGSRAGAGEKYQVPVGLAPLTNRNTCRHASRDCCEETKDWCLAEGFVWQACKNCYCGQQCMAPALFKD
jgi:hypothetical protein